MSSRRRATSTAHKWTTFEKHTLLCLMAKGIHLEERGKRTDEDGAMRQHAYLNVATELNKAVNGENGFGNDIDKKEVAKMIDKMLVEKKGVVGKGGYMERSTRGRVTRGLKRMWEREPSFDYDGSPSEWAQWRKKSEAEKRHVTAGGVPPEGVVVQSVEKEVAPEILRNIWHQASAGLPNPSATVNNPNSASATAPLSTGTHDSFNHLPPHLRGNDEYAWANNNFPTGNRSSHAGSSSNIDSYRPSYDSSTSARPSTSYPLTRYEPMDYDYPPPAIEPMLTPSITHNESSSLSKVSPYSGTVRPSATTHNSSDDAHLARAIESEMLQRKSSQFKKPGILKRSTNVYNSGDNSGERTPGSLVNSARKALFAGRDIDEGEVVQRSSGRPEGTKANREELPFNRLDQKRRGGEDTEMGGAGY